MKNITGILLGLGGLLLLAACSSYPLNMSEDEWSSLTPTQKYEARTKQAGIDAEDRQRRAEEKARKEALARERERERQARISQLYRNGRYGDFVQCIIRHPTVDFHPGWHEVDPIGFLLAKGEDKTIPIEHPKRSRTTSLWASFSVDGMTVELCRFNPQKRSYNACDSVVASYNELRRGISHTIDLPDLLRGTAECTLAPARGMPDVIIIERDSPS